MAKSIIVDHRGEPIERDLLKREIAEAQLTGTRSVWSHNSIASFLTPDRLAAVLNAAAQGEIADFLTMAEEMEERDLHYGSVIGTRKRACSGVDHEVVSASEDAQDEKIAQAVRDMVAGIGLPDVVEDTLDALGKGFSVVEIMWDLFEGQLAPVRLKWRDPRFFRFDPVTGERLLLITDDAPFGIELPAYKFITHFPGIKCGLPIRGGLARLAAVAYLCKSVALADWMVFAELFGMPIRVGKYGPGATNSEKNTLRNAVANIGSDAAAIIPQSMSIDLIERASTGGGDVAYQILCEWLDKQVSKGVLGQTMTSDDGSSRAQAEVHDNVRDDIRRADIRQLETTLNRDLIKPFVDLNFGQQRRYPRLRFPLPDPTDVAALTSAIKELVPLGLEVGMKGVLKMIGMPEAEEGEKLLRPNAWASTTPADSESDTALNREGRNQWLDTDDIADETLEQWEEQMAPVIDPLRELAAASATAEEFIEGLSGLLDEMDDVALVRALAISFFKARGVGDALD